MLVFLVDCVVGYYCVGGFKIDRLIDGVIGAECLEGLYCIEGSVILVLCFNGIFFNIIKNEKVEDCVDCISGFYCEGNGNKEFID